MKDPEQLNHYELLGLDRKATQEEIKEAYKEIAKVYHPDSNFYDEIVSKKSDPKQSLIFKFITAAYHTLVHPTKRNSYNQTLPPELRGWEDDSTEATTSWDQKKSRPRTDTEKRPINPKFGTVRFQESAFDEAYREKIRQRSVANAIRQRRSFLGRFFSLFGF